MEEVGLRPSSELIDNIDTINKVVSQLQAACELFMAEGDDYIPRETVEGVMWLFDDKLAEVKEASDGIYLFFKQTSKEGKKDGK